MEVLQAGTIDHHTGRFFEGKKNRETERSSFVRFTLTDLPLLDCMEDSPIECLGFIFS